MTKIQDIPEKLLQSDDNWELVREAKRLFADANPEPELETQDVEQARVCKASRLRTFIEVHKASENVSARLALHIIYGQEHVESSMSIEELTTLRDEINRVIDEYQTLQATKEAYAKKKTAWEKARDEYVETARQAWNIRQQTLKKRK
jgi:hypothetical protein